MKNILSVLLVLSITGCSNVSVNQPANTETVKTNTATQNDNVIVAKVSDTQGASFSTNISFDSFATKANVDGIPAKIPADVNKVDVYLFTLTSGFNGTDPFGASSVNVFKTFTNLSKTGSSFNILFQNVPGLASKQYYVGIVAKDTNGIVISKNPSTAWTGTTASLASGLALSTSGVGVDPTTMEVSADSDLVVNISLLDAVGAQINTSATVAAGNSNLPNLTAQ